MATLNELLQGAKNTQVQMEQLLEREQSQSAALTGLAGSVDTLIGVVTELRKNLSAEEQAVLDEAMASVAETLSRSNAALQRSGEQNTLISSVTEKAKTAAVPPAPPTPPAA